MWLTGWTTTPRMLATWEESMAPAMRFPGEGEGTAYAERVGKSMIVSGLAILLLIVTTLFVVRHAYQARQFNSGVPSSASLLATLLHPLAGLFVLVCSGSLEASLELDPARR